MDGSIKYIILILIFLFWKTKIYSSPRAEQARARAHTHTHTHTQRPDPSCIALCRPLCAYAGATLEQCWCKRSAAPRRTEQAHADMASLQQRYHKQRLRLCRNNRSLPLPPTLALRASPRRHQRGVWACNLFALDHHWSSLTLTGLAVANSHWGCAGCSEPPEQTKWTESFACLNFELLFDYYLVHY